MSCCKKGPKNIDIGLSLGSTAGLSTPAAGRHCRKWHVIDPGLLDRPAAGLDHTTTLDKSHSITQLLIHRPNPVVPPPAGTTATLRLVQPPVSAPRCPVRQPSGRSPKLGGAGGEAAPSSPPPPHKPAELLREEHVADQLD